MDLIPYTMKPDAYDSFDRAKKKVKELKSFYNHVWIFVVITAMIYVIRFYLLPKWGIISEEEGFVDWLNWNTYLLPLFWGFGLLIHGLWTFRHKYTNLRDWEEKKIQELMDKEENETKRWE